MEKITGAMTALITPFKNNEVDLNKYAQLIERQIRLGVNAVVPVGTTGESATLTHKEHKECIEVAVETCKNTNVKVIAGAGSNSTAEACDIAKHAQSVGADGLLSVTPYYNKPTQEGLYQHYKAIANSVDIPLVLYNVPGRTGVDLKADTVVKLFNNIENIYAIKEATGSIQKTVELLSKEKKLIILSGEDAIDFPMLASGAKGVISVTANLLPDLKSKLVNSVLEGNYLEAQRINEDLYPINTTLFCESNPIPIKAAMYIAGLLDSLEYRLPLTAPSAEHLKLIEKTLKKYKVIK